MLGKLKGAAALAKQAYETGAAQSAEAQMIGKVLQGPAGRRVHGIEKAPKPPPRIEDPAEWERVMRADLAVRDAAREPYLAPARSPLRISRFVAEGAEDVAQHLAASGLAGRPELVYGVYRVPDRVRGIVEWDIVHAATGSLAPAEPPAATSFDAATRWVERRVGDAGVFDEDLALAYLGHAGIGPERTLGIARQITIDPYEGHDEHDHRLIARVEGVHVFHAGPAAAAPPAVGPGPPEGVRLELLNWDAVALAVHPVRQQRPRLPSPFPYLPLTPQELLRAYLGIVGVEPHDSYAVQVTYNRPLDLMSRTSTSSHVRRTTGGDELPCADGKPRVRMHGGVHIVLAYRDAPEYTEGRRRWSAYQGHVLEADLAREIAERQPVPAGPGRMERTLDRVTDAVSLFDGDVYPTDAFLAPRYCWPPVSSR
jgi:hypothetical protein